MPRFILITGLPLAGKSTLCKAFAKLGLPTISVGDLAREEAKANNMTAREIGEWWRTIFGRHFPTSNAARVLLEAHPQADVLIVEGLREPEAVEATAKLGPVTVIACLSPLATRILRLKARARPGEKVMDLMDRDEQEIKWGVTHCINLADYVLITKQVSEDVQEAAATFYDYVRDSPNDYHRYS